MHQQPLLGLLPHPLYAAKSRLDGALAAQRAVEGDAEAVSLVPDALQQLQSLRIAVDEHRVGVPHPDDLLQALRETYHGQPVLYAEFAEGLPCEIQLTLAAVDDHQLGQVVGVFRKHPRISAVHDLLHGGVVVGADHGLYLELAVVFLGRLAVPEHHAGCHGIGALDVRIVETLHMHRQLLHTYGLAQLLEHRGPVFVGVGVLALPQRVETVFPGVLGAQFQQGQLVAPHGYAEVHAFHLHVRHEGDYDLPAEGAEL